MKYIGKAKIDKNDLEYYNKLLELTLDECDDDYDYDTIKELGARKDDYIGITSVDFENGNYITIDLASGGSNYYDNIVLWNKDGQELGCADCDYTIGSFELLHEDDIYEVRLEEE